MDLFSLFMYKVASSSDLSFLFLDFCRKERWVRQPQSVQRWSPGLSSSLENAGVAFIRQVKHNALQGNVFILYILMHKPHMFSEWE
jgi:hypothetical protein